MIKNLFINLLTLIPIISLAQNKVEYLLTENEDYHDEIKAIVNNKEYTLIHMMMNYVFV